MEIKKYTRKPFEIEAVQVTEQNFGEVAAWCKGEIVTTAKGETSERHIKVRVHRPLTERQTMAFPGDWVLFAGKGFKVYTDKAFVQSFTQIEPTGLVFQA